MLVGVLNGMDENNANRIFKDNIVVTKLKVIKIVVTQRKLLQNKMLFINFNLVLLRYLFNWKFLIILFQLYWIFIYHNATMYFMFIKRYQYTTRTFYIKLCNIDRPKVIVYYHQYIELFPLFIFNKNHV